MHKITAGIVLGILDIGAHSMILLILKIFEDGYSFVNLRETL